MGGVGVSGAIGVGHGIEAALSEGMAAGEPLEREPGAADGAETDHGDVGVFGAGGQVEALRGAEGVQDGRDDGLIGAEGETDGEAGRRWFFGIKVGGHGGAT